MSFLTSIICASNSFRVWHEKPDWLCAEVCVAHPDKDAGADDIACSVREAAYDNPEALILRAFAACMVRYHDELSRAEMPPPDQEMLHGES